MSTSSSLSRNWAPLSLPIDSRLQLDVTNGSDLGLGSDSTVGDGFDLASSSMVYSFVNCDSNFNPYPQLKKKILLIKFLENMTRYRY